MHLSRQRAFKSKNKIKYLDMFTQFDLRSIRDINIRTADRSTNMFPMDRRFACFLAQQKLLFVRLVSLQQILTTVMTNIVVDNSTDKALILRR